MNLAELRAKNAAAKAKRMAQSQPQKEEKIEFKPIEEPKKEELFVEPETIKEEPVENKEVESLQIEEVIPEEIEPEEEEEEHHCPEGRMYMVTEDIEHVNDEHPIQAQVQAEEIPEEKVEIGH